MKYKIMYACQSHIEPMTDSDEVEATNLKDAFLKALENLKGSELSVWEGTFDDVPLTAFQEGKEFMIIERSMEIGMIIYNTDLEEDSKFELVRDLWEGSWYNYDSVSKSYEKIVRKYVVELDDNFKE